MVKDLLKTIKGESMKISLKNLGQLREAELEIDDIAVIVGKNNSGKSTIGKAIYTVIKSFSEKLEKEHEIEKRNILENQIKSLINSLEREIKYNNEWILEINENLEKIEILEKKSTNSFFKRIVVQAEDLKMENFKLDFLKIKMEKEKNIIKLKEVLEKFKLNINKIELREIIRNLEHQRRLKMFSSLGSIEKEIDILTENFKINSSNLEAKKNILKRLLKIEFNNPVYYNKNILEIDIDGLIVKYNKEIDEIDVVEKELKYDSTIFVDTPMILNYLNSNFEKYSRGEHLINLIKTKDKVILEKEMYKKHIFIEETIKEILLGNIFYNDSNSEIEFIDKKDRNFGINDIASGLKSFGIILMIIRHLTSNTILILDEPEVHLHPEWQIELAKILCMINEKIGTKLILTTHSTFFLEAIEYHSKLSKRDLKTYYCENERVFSDEENILYQKVNGQVLDNLDSLREEVIESTKENLFEKNLQEVKELFEKRSNENGEKYDIL